MGTEKDQPGTADLRRVHFLTPGGIDARIILILLFLAIAGTIVLRIAVESTGYTTPDSHFYLRAAENLVAVKGLVAPLGYPFEPSTSEGHLAKWPAGYPVTIALTAISTGMSAFWSSKLVNLLFLGLIFYILYREFGAHAWFPALYFCSYGMLEVFDQE
jgi:hypothetical protein